MLVHEYAACDATALAELLRDRKVSAEEVYSVATEAITAVNSELNALAHGPYEQPLEYAVDGPFAGVPFLLKDLGAHPQGLPCRHGSRLSGDGVIYADESFLVRRFREAGLAIAGLTTVPELGPSFNTEPLVHGSTRNPWDVTLSAGGSSGGSGAMVAAGAVAAAHANDGAGSIRVPAAFNGLVGLKPSRGRISDGPDRQELTLGIAAEGVLTRTMRDCAALLDAVAGPMPGDKVLIKEPERPFSREVGADPGRLRIAVHTASWSGSQVDAEVTRAVQATVRQLEELGHEIESATPSFDWDAFMAAELTIFAAETNAAVDAIAAATGNRPSPETLEHSILALSEHGSRVTASELFEALQTVNGLSRTVGEFFTRWDLLITPTVAVPQLPLGYLNANDRSLDADGWIRHMFDLCSFTPLFNVCGSPAISLPIGWTSEELPIGIQLAAPMCEEARLIRVGSQLEVAMPWRNRRPTVHAGRFGVLAE